MYLAIYCAKHATEVISTKMSAVDRHFFESSVGHQIKKQSCCYQFRNLPTMPPKSTPSQTSRLPSFAFSNLHRQQEKGWNSQKSGSQRYQCYQAQENPYLYDIPPSQDSRASPPTKIPTQGNPLGTPSWSFRRCTIPAQFGECYEEDRGEQYPCFCRRC